MRVLKWIIDRCHGRVSADETALGWMPKVDDINLNGLKHYSGADYTPDMFMKLQSIDHDGWKKEAFSQDENFIALWNRLPKDLVCERQLLISRL
jgi:phosphoenolpyruvate carboxykinase (GTP)